MHMCVCASVSQRTPVCFLPGACDGIQTQEHGGWKDDVISALSVKTQSPRFHFFLRGWADARRMELAHNYTCGNYNTKCKTSGTLCALC